MIPDGWTNRTLHQLSRKPISYGIVQTGERVEGGVRCLRVVDITKSQIKLDDLITTSESISRSYKRTILEKEDVVLALRGEIGCCVLVTDEFVGCNLTRGLARIAPNRDVHPEFVVQMLCSPLMRRVFDQKKNGSALQEITITELRRLSIPLPPLPEQKKIAAILSTWDRAIRLTEKLVAAKQQRKQALMQRLLTGKVRLPGFRKHPWKKCLLGDVACNSSERIGSETKTPQVYSVTNSVGMVPMAEDVIGESIDRYKTVSKHDFAYNPMPINVGSIAMWQGADDVLVSPDYVVFRCGAELDAEFLNHFRKTHYWHQFVNRSGGGSVRVRIYFSDLAELSLNLPPLDEQKAIAAVLNTQDREIELLQQKLDALRRQKKGLLQQLLTGKIRVNVTGASRE